MKNHSSSINAVFNPREILVFRFFLLMVTLLLFFVGGKWFWNILYVMPSPVLSDDVLACLPGMVLIMLGLIILWHFDLDN